MNIHVSRSRRSPAELEREREEILARADNGLDIYKYYLQRYTNKPIRLRDSYLSPLPGRNEKTPSFNLFISNKDRTYWFCDHAYESGNAFKFVMMMEGISFGDAIKLIKRDILGDTDEPAITNLRRHFAPVVTRQAPIKLPPVITPYARPEDWYQGQYAAIDEDYYPEALFGTVVLAIYGAVPVSSYQFTNEEKSFRVYSSPADPLYGYYFDGRHKIVRPYVAPPPPGERSRKWLSNTVADEDIFGLPLLRALAYSLPAGKVKALVVLAGQRDTMAFHKLTGIAAVCFSAEKHIPTPEQVALLYSLAENVYVLYDIDNTGYIRHCILTDQDEEWRFNREGRYFGFIDAELTKPLYELGPEFGAKDVTKLLFNLSPAKRQQLRTWWRKQVKQPDTE